MEEKKTENKIKWISHANKRFVTIVLRSKTIHFLCDFNIAAGKQEYVRPQNACGFIKCWCDLNQFINERRIKKKNIKIPKILFNIC